MAISDLPLSFIGGLVLVFLGTLMTTMSVQLRTSATSPQGVKLLRAQCKDDEEFDKTAKRRQLLGWGLYMQGMSFGQLSLSLIPATVAACTTFSMALVWNGILAPFVLKEKFTASHFVGLILLVVGCCVALVFSSHESQDYDWPAMRNFVDEPIAFVPVGGGLAIVLIILADKRLRGSRLNAYSFAFIYSFIGALDLLAQKWFFQLGRIYVSCSGLLASTNSTLTEDSAPCNPPSLVSGVSMAVLGILHALVLVTENTATTFGDTLANRPLFLAADAVFQVLLCGVFFHEFSTFSETQYLYFFFGFFVMCCGVVVTIRAIPNENKDDIAVPLVTQPHSKLERAQSHQILRLGYRRCPLTTVHNHQIRRAMTLQGSLENADTA